MKCSRCDTPLREGMAKCKECGKWNIFEGGETKTDIPASGEDTDGCVSLNRVKAEDAVRIHTGPWDWMWGTTKNLDGTEIKGVVQTSTTLLGGTPGAGKTTLLLQMISNVCMSLVGDDVGLYIAAEQALPEISLTAERLKLEANFHNLLRNGDSRIKIISAMGGTANVGNILRRRRPRFVILDSLQGLCGRDQEMQIEVLDILKKYAVEIKAPIIIICQVTKDGGLAGLMTLQHHVDTTMTLFPDDQMIVEIGTDAEGNPIHEAVRIQEVMKNRFGRAFITQEYKMTEIGLEPYEAPEEDEDEDEEDEEEDE